MTFVFRLAVIARIHFLDSVIQGIALNAYLLKVDSFLKIYHSQNILGRMTRQEGREMNPALQHLEINKGSL